jgi:hypothetical protein
VRRALAGADRLLAEPACREVLTDFRDASARTLKEALDGSGVGARTYLRLIVFTDGRGLKACGSKGTLAATAPGSRVVFICPRAFVEAASGDPEEAEATLIHEMLHSLGLGENPPRSRDITARVRARCASPALVKETGSLRTDRLSPKQLQDWKKIVEIVMAEDSNGQPLHPTLRQLWDAVDTSGHVVYVEMPKRKSYIAGRFAITKVDPAGKTHEGILIMNLRAIDRVSTGPAAARADGFIPFQWLGKRERYAELLGHELAHAVWHLADMERAGLAERLQGETEKWMRMVLVARARGLGQELQERAEELARLGKEVEEPAEVAEVAIWEELHAGQRRR